MSSGSIQQLLVCSDVPNAVTVAPCPAGQAPSLIDAFVLSPSAASFVDAVSAPYDYTLGIVYWSVAFGFTLMLYLSARFIGQILNLVR